MRLLILLIGACGAQPNVITAPVYLTNGLTADDIKSVDVYVLDGQDLTGAPVTCEALANGIQRSANVEQLVVLRHMVSGPATEPTALDGMPVSDNLVVEVEGYASTDAIGSPVAFGCRDGVAIKRNRQTEISVTFVVN